jgi:hypothetical protein
MGEGGGRVGEGRKETCVREKQERGLREIELE